jgi:Rho-binding antiterminator
MGKRMSDYTPISCELYARYEHWIVRRRTIRIAWREIEPRLQTHVESLRPIDLQTRRHVEYLVARRPTGECLELRLDFIMRAEPL